MKRVTFLVVFTFLVIATEFRAAEPADRLAYPPAPKTDQIDDYFGTKVADPYRELAAPGAPMPSTVVRLAPIPPRQGAMHHSRA